MSQKTDISPQKVWLDAFCAALTGLTQVESHRNWKRDEAAFYADAAVTMFDERYGKARPNPDSATCKFCDIMFELADDGRFPLHQKRDSYGRCDGAETRLYKVVPTSE